MKDFLHSVFSSRFACDVLHRTVHNRERYNLHTYTIYKIKKDSLPAKFHSASQSLTYNIIPIEPEIQTINELVPLPTLIKTRSKTKFSSIHFSPSDISRPLDTISAEIS